MSAAYLHRLIGAAHDLAAHDTSIRQLLGTVDWGTCEAPEETDFETLSCLRQDFTTPIDDLFADRPVCAKCRENQDILKAVKVARRGRYLAMLRVTRLARHVAVPESR